MSKNTKEVTEQLEVEVVNEQEDEEYGFHLLDRPDLFNTGKEVPPIVQVITDKDGKTALDSPYAKKCFGLGIREVEALKAGFVPNSDWEYLYVQFGKTNPPEPTYVCNKPRLLVVKISPLLMRKERQKFLYDNETYLANKKLWECFRYATVFFVDENKQLMSERPFRLKLSGLAGMSFKDFYMGDPKKKINGFVDVYKSLYQQGIKDTKSSGKFLLACAIYEPKMEIKLVTSTDTQEQSNACLTVGFQEMTVDNIKKYTIPSMIKKEINPLILKLEQTLEETKDWLAAPSIHGATSAPSSASHYEEDYGFDPGFDSFSSFSSVSVKPILPVSPEEVQAELRKIKEEYGISEDDWVATVRTIATEALGRRIVRPTSIESQQDLGKIIQLFKEKYGDNTINPEEPDVNFSEGQEDKIPF